MNNFPGDLIPIGKIVKPHGIKGQIKLKLYNEKSSLLVKDTIVWLKKEIEIKDGIRLRRDITKNNEEYMN